MFNIIPEFETFINNNKKLIVYEFNNIDDKNNICDENNKLFQLNINDFNNTLANSLEFKKYIKDNYIDQSNELVDSIKFNKYKIISQTNKIILDNGKINNNKSYISTTLLNQSKIYDGITTLNILTDNSLYSIINIKIRTRTKNNDESVNITYRNIIWDLEFEKCDDGYKIIGLDNFIHISLIGLEEIFLDIEYKLELESELELEFGYLKINECFYNDIIKTNLKKHLYENEEYYSVDIIDYIFTEKKDINQEEKVYNDLYGTNYNILRIMSGMGGLSFSD